MSALKDARPDARDGEVSARHLQVDQLHPIPLAAPLGNPASVQPSTQSGLEGEAPAGANVIADSSNMIRPARTEDISGLKGERPLAMRSALTKIGHSASRRRNSLANVVLPAPLGPARITILLAVVIPEPPGHQRGAGNSEVYREWIRESVSRGTPRPAPGPGSSIGTRSGQNAPRCARACPPGLTCTHGTLEPPEPSRCPRPPRSHDAANLGPG